MEPGNIVAIAIAIIALVPSFIQWRKYQSEADAAHGDEAEKISAAWQKLNEPLLARVDHLEQLVIQQQNQINIQKAEIEELVRGVDALIEQIRGLNATPVYTRIKK